VAHFRDHSLHRILTREVPPVQALVHAQLHRIPDVLHDALLLHQPNAPLLVLLSPPMGSLLPLVHHHAHFSSNAHSSPKTLLLTAAVAVRKWEH